MITQQELDLIKSTFTSEPSKVKTKPRRVKFLGEFITTASKKTVWRNRGFAKSALVCHFQSSHALCLLAGKLFGSGSGYYHCKDLIRALEAQKAIEYVDVEIEELAQRKA